MHYLENIRLEQSKKIPFRMASKNNLFNSYKNGAKERDLSFNLDFEYFIQLTSSPCYYCGVKSSRICGDSINRKNYGFYICNGIDRLINNIGYEIENSVPCCKTCNWLKNKMDKDDFIVQIKKIYEFLHLG